MLVYAILILLPAATLAFLFRPCDKELLAKFFNVVDANNDTNVTEAEGYAFFQALDVNGDEILTLPEVQSRSPVLAPGLVGSEEYVFNLLDGNHNGRITKAEMEEDFKLIDTDGNRIKTLREWNRFVKNICPIASLFIPKPKCVSAFKCGRS